MSLKILLRHKEFSVSTVFNGVRGKRDFTSSNGEKRKQYTLSAYPGSSDRVMMKALHIEGGT
jgi:hypothetical protein